MMLVKHQGGIIIFTTFVVALLLTIAPLPDWGEAIRPEWVAMVLIYWCIALPDRIGVGTGWVVGIALDVAHGALLGQNAFTLSFVAYLALRLHQRMRLFPPWQQALSVLLLVAIYQILTLWIKGVVGQSFHGWGYWLHSVTSMLLWPFVFVILRSLRRYYRVR